MRCFECYKVFLTEEKTIKRFSSSFDTCLRTWNIVQITLGYRKTDCNLRRRAKHKNIQNVVFCSSNLQADIAADWLNFEIQGLICDRRTKKEEAYELICCRTDPNGNHSTDSTRCGQLAACRGCTTRLNRNVHDLDESKKINEVGRYWRADLAGKDNEAAERILRAFCRRMHSSSQACIMT